MPSNPLLDVLQDMVKAERKTKEFKRRLRVKGRVVGKSLTKKGNITLIVQRDNEDFKVTVLKSHQERFTLARSVRIGAGVSAAGIPRFSFIICTQLKILGKGLPDGNQAKLEDYCELSGAESASGHI